MTLLGIGETNGFESLLTNQYTTSVPWCSQSETLQDPSLCSQSVPCLHGDYILVERMAGKYIKSEKFSVILDP